MTASRPAVSCVCLTYGRPALLEEAIYSFLCQDYPGQKELIVLNDHDRQFLTFEQPERYPEVTIINIPRRFRTLGEKRNAAVALATHDLLFVWDDDDISLPHRLSYCVERFDSAKGYFKPDRGWWWDSGRLSGPLFCLFHCSSCWSRELFDRAGGYAPMGKGEDQEIENCFEQVRRGSTRAHDIRADEIYYIYRWGGTSSYHVSGLGGDMPDQNLEHAAVAAYVAAQERAGEVPCGRILLAPHWQTDYVALTWRHLAGAPA
jgi:glycosyltransferase involved in cell wall biosynthesis